MAPKKKVVRYTEEEDQAIIAYVDRHGSRTRGGESSPNGNKLWKEMEQLKVVNRSWQGMKHRYLHVLKPRLEKNTPSKIPLVTVTPIVPNPTTPQYQHSSEEFDIDDEEEGEEEQAEEVEEEEEEEVEEEEDRREDPPRRSPIPNMERDKRLSTNGVQKRHLERGAVHKLVSDLSLHFGVAQSVVYHALIIHSGDIELAEQYLESYGVIDTKPWNPVEDALLMSVNPSTQRLQSIIDKRGREETLARIEWLDS